MSDHNKPSSVNLRQIFLGLQDQLIASLGASREIIRHPGAKGQATELKWLHMLKSYLPHRYCADKAFVLDSAGDLSGEIDIVLYDRQYSPFLFNQEGVKYVPAESVYAVFEVRPELSAPNMKYAGEKAASVRRLRRTSAPIPYAAGVYPPKKPTRILAGILTLESGWKPAFEESFRSAVRELPPDGRVDLGCVLTWGGFMVRYKEDAELEIQTSPADATLIFFFVKLLTFLQEIGTVAALDYNEYSRVL